MKDEKDKYYTPDIEELYVGFECEYEVSDVWEPIIVGIEGAGHYDDIWCFEFSDYNNAINTKSIRVKYLDKEDIESLGFEFFNFNMFKKPAYVNESQKAYITQLNDHEYNIRTPDNSFNGIVKSKSELKILLKQLKIT